MGALLLLACGSRPLSAQEAEPPKPAFRSDRILIRPLQKDIDSVHASLGTKVLRSYPLFDNIQVIRLPTGLDPRQAVSSYQKSGMVSFAELDSIGESIATPNDPWFTYQWALPGVGAIAAWDVINSAPNVVVAVMDSGICLGHEDLDQNLWTNPNGGTFLHGINAVDDPPSGNIVDNYGHGTQVAGVIGAVGNNATGVSGVAWNVKLMPCKWTGSDGNGAISDLIECMNFAVQHRAHIVNISQRILQGTESLRLALSVTAHYGIIVVAGAGNQDPPYLNNDAYPKYPSCYDQDNIMSVTATTSTDGVPSGYDYGLVNVDLGAPGVWIATTGYATNLYNYNTGTSFSAAMVSGSLALLKARFPFNSYMQLQNRIMSSATALTSLTGLCSSGARLYLNGAVAATLTAPPRNDNFANALPYALALESVPVTAAVNNADATKEAGEPNHAGNAGGRSVWWKWTPTANTTISIGTLGSGFDTLLAVYTGSLGNLTEVVSDDNSGGNGTSLVRFTGNAGTTYYIAADGFNGACGTLKVCFSWYAIGGRGNLNFGTLQRASGSFAMQLVGGANRKARVESSTDLHAWTIVADNVQFDAAGIGLYTDTAASVPFRFYRAAYNDYGVWQWAKDTVAFVDLSIPAQGSAFVANPLIVADTLVSSLFAGVPSGTTVSKWNESSQSWNVNTYNGTWSIPAMTLSAGEGALVTNPSASALTIRLKGALAQGYRNNSVPNGWSMRSPMLAEAGRLVTDLGFPVMNGDSVVRRVNGADVTYSYSGGAWTPSEPAISMGESFRSYKNVGFAWYRNYLAWP